MLIKILGIADITAALIFFISTIFSFIPQKIIIIISVYLIIKGIIFAIMLDIASIIDIIAGTIILSSIYVSATLMHPIIVFIVCFFLIQKGIFSLM